MSRDTTSSVLLLGLIATVSSSGCVVAGQPDAATSFSVEALDNPAPPGSTTPNLTADSAGRVYLSWVAREADVDRMQYAVLVGATWSEPVTIAAGDDWFVNWADVSSLAVDEGGPLAAHFLRRNGDDTYAYDAVLTTADADGEWRPAEPLHRDRSATEHGFVSLLPLADGTLFATWLDGRNYAGVAEPHLHGGPMTLRYGIFDAAGTVLTRGPLDEGVCDCCPTTAVETPDGVLVAYRDRTEDEVRDIQVVRIDEDGPGPPQAVHDDGWKIQACPVNGPALVAQEAEVGLAWFTAAGDAPQVRVAFSHDAGNTFGAPYRLDEGRPLGRVAAIMLDDGTVIISWLEVRASGTHILYRHVGPTGPLSEPSSLADTSSSRASGYPRLARSDRGIVGAWTEPGNPSYIRTAVLRQVGQ